MTDTKQPEAMRLAACLQDHVVTYPQLSEDEPGGYCGEVDQVMDEAAAELRRLHAENITLQQGYDAARLEIESLKAQIAAALPGQQDYPESPMKKVAQALREKAAAEREAFDRRIQSGEWGPEPDTEADSWVLPEPVSDVWTTFRGERCLTPAGDDYYTSVQVRAAYEAGLAAPPTAQPAPVAQGDAASTGFFLQLPQRPKPEAPAGTVGLDWDAYSGAQMLAYGRDCSNAAIVSTQKQGCV